MKRALAAVATLSAALALAPAPGRPDEPAALQLDKGDRLLICRTGLVTCPTGPVRCDAEGVVRAEDTPRDGIALVAVGAGTTLCGVAAASGMGPRRVFRVTVTGPKKTD